MRAIIILAILYTAVSTLDYHIMQEEANNAPIASWGEWADAGCTEDSRKRGTAFDKLCSDWEQKATK